jgi:hypothetical protein
MEFFKSADEVLKMYNDYLEGKFEFKDIKPYEKLKFVYLKANTLSGYIKAFSGDFLLLQVANETGKAQPMFTLVVMKSVVDISEKGSVPRRSY